MDEQKTSPLIALSEVEELPTNWAWPGRFPLDMVSLLTGPMDIGKSLIVCDICARITSGAPWPDSGNRKPRPPGRAVLLSTENDTERTLKRRVRDAGADLARVAVLKPSFAGESWTEYAAAWLGNDPAEPKVLVLDPLIAFLEGKYDENKASDVRRVLRPIEAFARTTGAAVIGIMHITKGQRDSAHHRVAGSGAFMQVARAASVVGKDKSSDDENARVFVQLKNNVGKKAKGMQYRITDDDRLHWGGESDLSADDLLGDNRRSLIAAPAQEACAEDIRALMARGPISSNELETELIARGHKRPTIQRTRKALHVRAIPPGRPGVSKSQWVVSLNHTPERAA